MLATSCARNGAVLDILDEDVVSTAFLVGTRVSRGLFFGDGGGGGYDRNVGYYPSSRNLLLFPGGNGPRSMLRASSRPRGRSVSHSHDESPVLGLDDFWVWRTMNRLIRERLKGVAKYPRVSTLVYLGKLKTYVCSSRLGSGLGYTLRSVRSRIPLHAGSKDCEPLTEFTGVQGC